MNSLAKTTVFQTVYVSSASELIGEPTLELLLSDSRAKNVEKQVTGILLYANGNIMQVLEGEQMLIEELMLKIARDPRPKGVIVLLQEAIEERQFAKWSMAYKRLITAEADGVSNFLSKSPSNDEAQIKASLAKSLLVRFKNSMT
jgi:predicted sulfurtransferase